MTNFDINLDGSRQALCKVMKSGDAHEERWLETYCWLWLKDARRQCILVFSIWSCSYKHWNIHNVMTENKLDAHLSLWVLTCPYDWIEQKQACLYNDTYLFWRFQSTLRIHPPVSTVARLTLDTKSKHCPHPSLSLSLCPVSSGSAVGSDCAEANTKSCCCISPLEVWIPQYCSVCFVSIRTAALRLPASASAAHETHHCCRGPFCRFGALWTLGYFTTSPLPLITALW